MGYRGKLEERNRARDLRAQAWTLAEIAEELGVSKSSVSLWVRAVRFDESDRKARELERKGRGQAAARRRGPNALQRPKQEEIDELEAWGLATIGRLTERELMAAGAALYAGEGAKRDGTVKFANTDPQMIRLFCAWLRCFFDVDESRLRVRLYLHQGLDIEEANALWSEVTGIPLTQFGKPYRAAADPSIRTAKHVYGCVCIVYSCSRTHRAVTGLVGALLSSEALPG